MDDLEIRLAAFDHLSKLTRIKGEVLSWDLLTQPYDPNGFGFLFVGLYVSLVIRTF